MRWPRSNGFGHVVLRHDLGTDHSTRRAWGIGVMRSSTSRSCRFTQPSVSHATLLSHFQSSHPDCTHPSYTRTFDTSSHQLAEPLSDNPNTFSRPWHRVMLELPSWTRGACFRRWCGFWTTRVGRGPWWRAWTFSGASREFSDVPRGLPQ